MLNDNLNGIIKDLTLNKMTDELNVVRSIKNAFVNYTKEGKTLTEADEVRILMKMKTQREDSIRQYKEGGRMDLVESEEKELGILTKYIPEQPTDEQIEKYAEQVVSDIINEKGSISVRDTKDVLTKVQGMYPTASGKIVSMVIKKYC